MASPARRTESRTRATRFLLVIFVGFAGDTVVSICKAAEHDGAGCVGEGRFALCFDEFQRRSKNERPEYLPYHALGRILGQSKITKEHLVTIDLNKENKSDARFILPLCAFKNMKFSFPHTFDLKIACQT